MYTKSNLLITGILDRTGTPIDRTLYINIEGFFLLRGHASKVNPTQPGGGRLGCIKMKNPAIATAGRKTTEGPKKLPAGSKTDSDHHDHKDEGTVKSKTKKDDHDG